MISNVKYFNGPLLIVMLKKKIRFGGIHTRDARMATPSSGVPRVPPFDSPPPASARLLLAARVRPSTWGPAVERRQPRVRPGPTNSHVFPPCNLLPRLSVSCGLRGWMAWAGRVCFLRVCPAYFRTLTYQQGFGWGCWRTMGLGKTPSPPGRGPGWWRVGVPLLLRALARARVVCFERLGWHRRSGASYVCFLNVS